jgi:D-methionine transport system ATP-binding protein
VGIARALATNPKILLCDEATSALDPQTTTSILRLISDIQKRLNLTVILITHEMKVITEICDRVAVMEDGQIVELGEVTQVFTNPQSPVTQGFVEVILSKSSRFLENGYQSKGTLVRLSYLGEVVTSPLVAELVKAYDLEPIILQAHVDHIKDTPYGTLILDLIGPKDNLTLGLERLKSQGIRVEILRPL